MERCTSFITDVMANMDLNDVSQYLTFEVIDKIFKKKTRTQGDVIKTKVARAGPAGEGLISAVYRITASSDQYTTSFIAKGLVSDLLLRKTLACDKLFAREIVFYTNILPVLIDTQRSLNAKESIQNYVPICYSSYCDGQNDYVILDDLSESGFHSINDSPNEIEYEGILKTLAHLHAVSMAVRLKNPEQFFKFVNECPEFYYTPDRKDWYGKYLTTAIDIDKKIISEYEKNTVYYKKFMSVASSDIYQQMIDISSTPGDHVVLNHGDCWCPNFMSSKDQIMAIDFQIFRFASPVTDLALFLFCNIHSILTKEDFLKSVDIYYKYLGYFLNDMGINIEKVFPRHALNAELKKYGRLGFFAALSTIPLILSEKCDVMSSFEDKFADCDVIPLECLWRLRPIESHEHKMRLVSALRVAVDLGLF